MATLALYQVSKQPKTSATSLQSALLKLNQCAANSATFLTCALPQQKIIAQLTSLDKIEETWIKYSVQNNWPNCHEALHQLGHLLPVLTPAELRSATSGACAYGLLMGYAENSVKVQNDSDIVKFNKEYCDPSLNNLLIYSEICSHVTGHLAYNHSKQDTPNSLSICSKVTNHPDQCASGVYMLNFENADKLLTANLPPQAALERCAPFSEHPYECVPYASKKVTINSAEDLQALLTVCYKYARQYLDATTCDGVLTFNFAKLKGEELLNSSALCMSYPDTNKCLHKLFYVAAFSTNSIETLNKICKPPLDKTIACINREEEFNRVFGQHSATKFKPSGN